MDRGLSPTRYVGALAMVALLLLVVALVGAPVALFSLGAVLPMHVAAIIIIGAALGSIAAHYRNI
jgi:hypothetical protein